MRDKRYVSGHRGGPLSKEDHKRLALWAADCAAHCLTIITEGEVDSQAKHALETARRWADDKASVGDARNAAFAAHAAAKEKENEAESAALRACGHAVATAHMADHALQAAAYALKALRLRNLDVDKEKAWQNSILPGEIQDLVLSSRK